MKLPRRWMIVGMLIGFCAFGASAKTLRIVSYNIDCADQGSDNNITSSTHSLPTVVQAVGLHHIGTNAQPVDVLGLEELRSTTLSAFVTQLNTIYGAGTYMFDPTSDPNTGGGPDGLIYRTNTVQVVSARALKTGQTVLLRANSTYTSASSPGGWLRRLVIRAESFSIRPLAVNGSGIASIIIVVLRKNCDENSFPFNPTRHQGRPFLLCGHAHAQARELAHA